jgi:hypothetical protein
MSEISTGEIGFCLELMLQGLAMLWAAIVLIRRRARSRRATTLALAAITCLAVSWLLSVVMYATFGFWKHLTADDRFIVAMSILYYCRRTLMLGAFMLFVWATVTDRVPVPATDAETDYRDSPPSPPS